jgi:hypothetical protein
LELGARLRRHSRQPGRRGILADDRGDLDPDVQETPGADGGEALKFFSWAFEKGATMAEDLDYIPMPKTVVDSVKKTWTDEVKDASGKPIFAMAR